LHQQCTLGRVSAMGPSAVGQAGEYLRGLTADPGAQELGNTTARPALHRVMRDSRPPGDARLFEQVGCHSRRRYLVVIHISEMAQWEE
jgi:protoheme ferro-lyase